MSVWSVTKKFIKISDGEAAKILTASNSGTRNAVTVASDALRTTVVNFFTIIIIITTCSINYAKTR